MDSRDGNKENNPFVKGMIVAVDKPLEWTSFDIVNKFRYLLSRRLGIKRMKVGHAGTLDPLATGLVIVCTGKNTKMIEELMGHSKTYETTIRLGATTPSFDMETDEDATFSIEGITRERVEGVLTTFEGEIDQVPPTFSAVKIDGKRAYEHARQGQQIDLPPKRVIIYSIEILSYELPDIILRIKCGRGTYIRAIARDLGERLGCGAYLRSLRRTQVGEYHVADAIKVEDFGTFIEGVLNKAEENKTEDADVF